MRIYKMTATFGKLEHQTLTLNPGLNVIEAPNEWGKSTWCAFLVDMLYGIDTREKTTKNSIADKEKYAPWSGLPMSGRMDLCWNGKDITIERRTKGRIPMGEFQAYETASGMEIPELNSSNCGQMLLGVERSVFTRSGFIRFSDLPVTQDDSLRRRLNNLVTTGDESGAGDRLSKTLKELKNQCRYNHTGLLPQAENERELRRQQLEDLQSLARKVTSIQQRQKELRQELEHLENHREALAYEASLNDLRQVDNAIAQRDAARKNLEALESRCAALPSQEEARKNIRLAEDLKQQHLAVQMETQMLPQKPEIPEIPECYAGISPEEAAAYAQKDFDAQKALEKDRKKWNRIFILYGVFAALLLAGLAVLRFAVKLDVPVIFLSLLAVTVICGIVLFAASVFLSAKRHKNSEALFLRHPGISPDNWVSHAEAFAEKMADYRRAQETYQSVCADLDSRKAQLAARTTALTGADSLEKCQEKWQQILRLWELCGDTRRDYQRQEEHTAALQAMVKTQTPPQAPDTLDYSAQQTVARIESARLEQQQLRQDLGQCIGQAESIGQASAVKARLDILGRRIARLEDTYYALELAQDLLFKASTALQRRFAPRISSRAQELLSGLTGGRYQRVTLSEDFSVNASAAQEDTLRSPLWRSDGTCDQLYLALRIAVAEALTPEAPLVLDDALARFDDTRLSAALGILKKISAEKQILLFTCQSRENTMLSPL